MFFFIVLAPGVLRYDECMCFDLEQHALINTAKNLVIFLLHCLLHYTGRHSSIRTKLFDSLPRG